MSAQSAPQFAWDVDRYHRAIETGVFTKHDRIELIEGELLPVPPSGPAHQSVVDELSKQLTITLGDDYRVRTQGPVVLPPDSEPEPDILVARFGQYITAHPNADDAVAAIEVADTSRSRDEMTKLRLYARHGIPEFWLVDVDERLVHIYSGPSGEAYTSHTQVAFAQGAITSPILDREIAFDLPTTA